MNPDGISEHTILGLEALGTKARTSSFVGSPMYYASLYLIGGLLFIVVVLLITLAICQKRTRMMNEVVIMQKSGEDCTMPKNG